MGHILDRNLKLWHLVVLGLLMSLVVGSGMVIASDPKVFFSGGSVRLASAASKNSVSISGTDTPPVRVLKATFSVPSGKTADLQATFSSSVHYNVGTYAYCFGTFTLDGAPPDNAFKPGPTQLLGGATATQPAAVGAAMAGFRSGVGPGTHTVNVYITRVAS